MNISGCLHSPYVLTGNHNYKQIAKHPRELTFLTRMNCLCGFQSATNDETVISKRRDAGSSAQDAGAVRRGLDTCRSKLICSTSRSRSLSLSLARAQENEVSEVHGERRRTPLLNPIYLSHTLAHSLVHSPSTRPARLDLHQDARHGTRGGGGAQRARSTAIATAINRTLRGAPAVSRPTPRAGASPARRPMLATATRAAHKSSSSSGIGTEDAMASSRWYCATCAMSSATSGGFSAGSASKVRSSLPASLRAIQRKGFSKW